MSTNSPRRFLIWLCAIALLPAVYLGWTFASGRRPFRPFRSSSKAPIIYIAHACGGFEGNIHTSSLEAMEKSYAEGYRLFELDVEYTTDHHVVLVHDWDTFYRFSNLNHRPTFEEYKNARMRLHFQPPTVERLQGFLKTHPDAFIIIDSKHSHVAFLKDIAQNFPDILPQAMPYVYAERDYNAVRNLGYRNIIFACYLSKMTDDEVIAIVERHPFFAVAVPANRPNTFRARRCGDAWCLPQELKAHGVKLFMHVINLRATVEEARKEGVSGIMSDWIIPGRYDIRRTQPELAKWREHPV